MTLHRRSFWYLFCALFFGLCIASLSSVSAKTMMPKKPKNKALNEKIEAHRNVSVAPATKHTAVEKEWNFYVYIAGENNLAWFVDINCEQMSRVGSNENINILCSVDRFAGGPLYRAEIDKATPTDDGIHQVWRTVDHSPEEQAKNPKKFFSGTRESLYSFLQWGIKKYPARRHCLILWNHGSGILDPLGWGRIMNDFHNKMFKTDPETGEVSLIRTAVDEEHAELGPKRGIAFNDSRGTFIDNQGLSDVLEAVCKEIPAKTRGSRGGKFDIIGMDACCMANVEIATQLKNYTDYIVFSQEVELGAGWNYEKVLRRAAKEKLTPDQFCFEMTKGYEEEYTGVVSYFTMSTVDLQQTEESPSPAAGTSSFVLIEKKLSELSRVLVDVIENSPNGAAARNKIRHIRNKPHLSTSFHSDKYIDLRKFLRSLSTGMQATLDHVNDKESRSAIIRLTTELIELINHVVPYFTAGSMFGASPPIEEQRKAREEGTHRYSIGDYSKARGLSIYFPTREIHRSYYKTAFAQSNNWIDFLKTVLKRRR